MRGSGHRTPHSEVELLQQQIDDLKKQLDRVTNDRTPTVPIYDPDNFPAVSVEGQIAQGNDNTFWEFQNGTWTKIGPTTVGADTDNFDRPLRFVEFVKDGGSNPLGITDLYQPVDLSVYSSWSSNDVPSTSGYGTPDGYSIANDGSWSGDYFAGATQGPASPNTLAEGVIAYFRMIPAIFLIEIAIELHTTGSSDYNLTIGIRGPQGHGNWGSYGSGFDGPGDVYQRTFQMNNTSVESYGISIIDNLPKKTARATFTVIQSQYDSGGLSELNVQYLLLSAAQDSGGDVNGQIKVRCIRLSPTTI